MKKALSLLLVFAMLVGVTGAFAGEYQDTANHWAEEAIDRWTSAGVVSGSKGAFRPDGQMTRAEAAQVFANLLKLTEKADLSGYADVDAGAWYADAMAACVARGIFQGNGKGSMLPTANVSRETFFVMLARGLGITPEKNANHDFADVSSVSSWAEGYVNALVNRGYVQGAGGSLAPAVEINRASVMALLDQTICAYVTEEGASVAPTEDGVVLVVANNVTVSGDFSGDVVVASEGAQVSLKGATGEVNVNVVADDVAVTDAPVGATIQVGDGVEGATANGAELAAGEGGVVADGGVVMPEGTQPEDPTKPDDGKEDQKPGEEEHIHSYATPSYSVGEDGRLMVSYECSCADVTAPAPMTESLGLSAVSNGLDVHGRIYENGYATFVLPVGEVTASNVTATITAGAYQWVIDIETDLTQNPSIEAWLDEVITFEAATMTITAGDAQAVYSFEDAVQHNDAEGNPKAYTVYATVDDVQPLVDVLEDSANVAITDSAEGSKFSINLGSELTMGDKILTYAAGVTEPIVLTSADFADSDTLSSEIRTKTELKDATTDADLIAHLTAGTVLTIGTKQVELLKDLTITIDNMNGAAGNCTLNQCLVRLQDGNGEYNTAQAVLRMVNDIVACLSGSNATCTIEFAQ